MRGISLFPNFDTQTHHTYILHTTHIYIYTTHMAPGRAGGTATAARSGELALPMGKGDDCHAG